ncbi:DUF456 domain-containing protein [Candidatus Omnitrophota bacterium]
METVALLFLILCSVVGFVAIFFTTFGTMIILIGAVVYATLTDFSVLSFKPLAWLLVLYLCGEVVENVLVIVGVKKLGASNAAVVGALVGGILGAIVGAGFLGIGAIVGSFLGIFLGALTVELIIHGDVIKSLKAGAGGLLGRFGSIIVKVIIAVLMFSIIIMRIIHHLTHSAPPEAGPSVSTLSMLF